MAEADEGAVVCGASCGGDRSSGVLAAETADEATGGLQGPNLADEAGHGAGRGAVSAGEGAVGCLPVLGEASVGHVEGQEDRVEDKAQGFGSLLCTPDRGGMRPVKSPPFFSVFELMRIADLTAHPELESRREQKFTKTKKRYKRGE